jgi:hypothetical protein
MKAFFNWNAAGGRPDRSVSAPAPAPSRKGVVAYLDSRTPASRPRRGLRQSEEVVVLGALQR